MSDVSITLPDGSRHRCRRAPLSATSRTAISPRLARVALAGIVDERPVDFSFPLEKDASVRVVTPDSPEALLCRGEFCAQSDPLGEPCSATS